MVINVLHSIGDILFCEPIYRFYWTRDGVKPTVVIRDHLMWLQIYIESANFLGASKWDGDVDDAVMTDDYIPLRFANQVHRGYDKWDDRDLENCMLDKYRLLMLPDELWKTISIKLNDGFNTVQWINGPFILINERSQAGNIDIPFNGKRHIKMYDRPYATLVDWWRVIRDAEENHHVSTSTFFLMQAIKNKYPNWNVPCYIYPRPNHDGLRGISQLRPDFNLIRVRK